MKTLKLVNKPQHNLKGPCKH